MSKEEHIHFTGTVIKQLVAGKYQVKVKLGDGDSGVHIINVGLSGKMKHNKGSQRQVKLIEGDTVEVNVSPYDLNNGMIVSLVRSESEMQYAKNRAAEFSGKKVPKVDKKAKTVKKAIEAKVISE